MKTADPTLLNDADFAVQVTLERAERTASRWRNVYWALTGQWADGDTTNPYIAPKAFPSRGEAEDYAEKYLAGVPPFKRPFYLGAIPAEGDA